MSKFFVGQRVRIVRATHPQNNGLTGVISHIGPWEYLDILPSGRALGSDHADCYLKLDRPRHDGNTGGANSFWQIEPILPEGSAPSEFTFQQLMDSLQEVMA